MTLAYSSTALPLDLNPDGALNSGKRKLHEGALLSPSKRTKTVGPFVMEDDPDEDDADKSMYDLGFETRATDTNIQPHRIVDPPDTSPSEEENFRGRQESTAQTKEKVVIRTCSGKSVHVSLREKGPSLSYEQMIAARSVTAPGKATKSYYGIDLHTLLDASATDSGSKSKKSSSTSSVQPSIEGSSSHASAGNKQASLMWTEKYRARKFKDLIGDERTHRLVLRWLKSWDPIVFPGFARQKAKRRNDAEEEQHRKVLLLTGPAGLGKTTLAHVCAKQAGYEVLEINASDERSRDVVKGRIREAVGTENVKGTSVDINGQKVQKSGKPVCVVVDEVDGVVTGSGGGEGGFMKALVDLLTLDQQNSNKPSHSASKFGKKSKKGDKFRLLRPIILVCNDVYHPSLRPLRTSYLAETINVRQVPLEQVVQRMRNVFQNEGVPCDGDGVRKLCEASWGLSGGGNRQAYARGASQGDIRGVLVAAEWVAHQLRYSGTGSSARLSRQWVEQHILNGSQGGRSSRGLGRGGTRDVVERVFIDGAGFPYQRGTTSFQDPPPAQVQGAGAVGVADMRKRRAIEQLTEMIDAAGEYDRCITGCFLAYPSQNYQDDTVFSKPNTAYDWLHFHDSLSSRVYSHQDWELNPYLSQPVVAFHHLFSSPSRPPNPEKEGPDADDDEDQHPFSGPRADFSAFETGKQNRAILSEFQYSLSAPLLRIFRSSDTVATELVPSLLRILAPDVKPVIVGGNGGQGSIATVRKDSERTIVKAAVGVMNAVGVKFERKRVEMDNGNHGGWVFRMEPPLDTLSSFSKTKDTPLAAGGSSSPVRYAIRRVLEQEYYKDQLQRQAQQQQKRLGEAPSSSKSASSGSSADAYGSGVSTSRPARLNGPKRDFFGRIVNDTSKAGEDVNSKGATAKGANGSEDKETKVWVSYHEGFSNAVRKGISMRELLSGL